MMDPKAIGQLPRDFRAYEGSFVTRCALLLAPLAFVRPGELRRPNGVKLISCRGVAQSGCADESARDAYRPAVYAGC
jgi:hypothetical protein